MGISGTEPSSVMLSQKGVSFKTWKVMSRKCQKQAESKRFAKCCTSVSDFNSKNFQITSKLLTQGTRYHKLRKTFGKFFRSYSDLLSKFGEILSSTVI